MSGNLRALLMEDILLNIFEFLDRSFVLETISFVSKYLHRLCHKPYNYNRLIWRFSKQYYEKLRYIKPYYTKVQTIEVSDSDKFGESIIEEKRTREFIQYLIDQKDSIKRLDLIFNRNQNLLFQQIVHTSHDWLRELSLCIIVDAEFAKYACSNLKLFKHLKVLKLIVGNSVDADVIIQSCKEVLNGGILETFISTIYLRTDIHVKSFINCISSSTTIRNIAFSLNCESLNDELVSSLVDCLGRESIHIRLFNVPSIAFLNKFKEISTFNRELIISVIVMQNNDKNEPLCLSKVYEFNIEMIKFNPSVNQFPVDVRKLKISSPVDARKLKIPSLFDARKFKISSILQYPLTKFPKIDDLFTSRYSNLCRLELSVCHIRIDSPLKNCLSHLDFVQFEMCEVTSVESIIELSTKLKVLRCLSCSFQNETHSLPSQSHYLRELNLLNCKGKDFYLTALDGLRLESLTMDYFIDEPFKLYYIENMSSLEYLHISSSLPNNNFVNNLNFKNLNSLKYFIYDSAHELYQPIPSFFTNPLILRNTFIIFSNNIIPKSLMIPSISDLKIPTINEHIVNAIPNTMKKEISSEGFLNFFLYDANVIYIQFSVKKKAGFLLVENKEPYNNIIACRISKNELEMVKPHAHSKVISFPKISCSIF